MANSKMAPVHGYSKKHSLARRAWFWLVEKQAATIFTAGAGRSITFVVGHLRIIGMNGVAAYVRISRERAT